MNDKISTSNKSSVSTLTSPSITSTNDERCSLFSPIHENIKYSYLSKTQAIYVRRASGLMNSQIKLLAHKICNYVILEYFLKNKAMEEVVS